MGINKSAKLVLISFLFLFLFVSLIEAQPFSTEFESDGLRVLAPENFPLKQNQGFNFTFHVFNTTSNVDCNFFLYHKNGSIILNQKNISGAGSFFYTFVTGDNFSETTEHDFVTACSSVGTEFTGGVRTSFKVTPTGFEFETADSVIYLITLSLMVFFFVLSLWGSFVIPWKNNRDDTGKVISVNDLKYLKLFAMVMSYMFLMFIAGIGHQLTANFLLFRGAENFFNLVFQIMLRAIWPIIVVSFVVLIFMLVDDTNVRKTLKRIGNMEVDGGRFR